MAYLSLSAVSVAVFGTLNVAGLTALVSTRIYDDIPQAPTYPFIWYEVRERDVRGFGTGGLPEVLLRVHCFSQYQGAKESQDIIAKVIELLRDQALTITGYEQAGRVFYDDTVPVPTTEIAGKESRELVALFRIYAREQ